ncbi:uncharacterized protein [Arachis hypogaea]|uniref:uncharacterized protein isoform X1 n=1 Tax=Arachis hypogaea TaxID=3818 RepID=UPI003B21C991
MREESRSATDALASAVEGVRRPRSIIRIVAVNYFSPALILLEGLRYHCCGCCHELGIKGIAVLNPAITTSRYFLAEIEGPEQKSDSEAEKGLQMLLDSDLPALEVDFLELQKLNWHAVNCIGK